MKIVAIAAALVCLVSFVTAADEHATMDAGMASNMAMTPGLRGTSLGVRAGIITNTIDAKNNNVVVYKSNILLSKSDRVQIAKIIKEKMASHPEEVDLVAANEVLEQLEPDNGNNSGTTASVATNPAVISNVVSSIFSAIQRNPAGAVGHAVGAIGAAIPVIMAPTPVSTRYNVNNPMRQIPAMSSTAMGSDNSPPSGAASPSS